jgi:hypothetical protein
VGELGDAGNAGRVALLPVKFYFRPLIAKRLIGVMDVIVVAFNRFCCLHLGTDTGGAIGAKSTWIHDG